MTADDEIGPVAGMHHILPAEDLPLIPTIWPSIRLRPSNVLGRNPATDLCGEARYKKILVVSHIPTGWNDLARSLVVLDALRRPVPRISVYEWAPRVRDSPDALAPRRYALLHASVDVGSGRRGALAFIDPGPPRATLRSALAPAVSAARRSPACRRPR